MFPFSDFHGRTVHLYINIDPSMLNVIAVSQMDFQIIFSGQALQQWLCLPGHSGGAQFKDQCAHGILQWPVPAVEPTARERPHALTHHAFVCNTMACLFQTREAGARASEWIRSGTIGRCDRRVAISGRLGTWRSRAACRDDMRGAKDVWRARRSGSSGPIRYSARRRR